MLMPCDRISQWLPVVSLQITIRKERAVMEEFIKELNERKAKARLMGGESKVALQHQLGHLTARERIEKLVDPASFMELGLLNHSDTPGVEDKTPADGLVAGLAKINGRPVAVSATDKTVLAGTEGTVYMRKERLLAELAIKRGHPLIHLGEGGGLRMPDGMGSDGISERMMPMHFLRHGRQTLNIAPSWVIASVAQPGRRSRLTLSCRSKVPAWPSPGQGC
jgi:acetyl-CoA carboxylase carboxyltransferase component